jgi:hypothetical protein
LERIKKRILFLTAVKISNIEEKGIYTDLLRKFHEDGCEVFVVCPDERRYGGVTRLNHSDKVNILYVKTLNLQKTGLLEKGLSTLTFNWLLYRAIKKYFKNIKFDLILYSTPPITYNLAIDYLKKRDKAVSYLLLKDIFPQNAVDLKIITKGGIIHRYFTYLEKKLYSLSDFIGCMSEANKQYILEKNNFLIKDRIEINHNSIDLKWLSELNPCSSEFKKKWNINQNALICIYGGNLGKPQGLNFLINILSHYHNDHRIFFFVIGDGTEFDRINFYFNSAKPSNAILKSQMRKEEFDELIKYGDSGLILLDNRFTIPNFPSRLLTYMENKMSIWAATDKITDLREVITENNLGFWVENGDDKNILIEIEKELCDSTLPKLRGRNSFNFLKNNYSSEKSYQTIIKHLQ